MQPTSGSIISLDLKTASEREYAALSDLFNRIRSETHPDDPPIPLETRVRRWQNLPPFMGISVFIAREPEGEKIKAAGMIQFMRTQENQHLAQFDLNVLPEYRRQGLGSRLLAEIVKVAVRENRRVLVCQTNERIPAGEALMSRISASKGLEGHTNQLKIEDLNPQLIEAWQERAKERASGFEIGFWNGAYPEEQLAAIAELMEVMNEQPHGEIELEDMHYTPELLRQMEAGMFADGTERWTLYARKRATGEFAGFTDVMWRPTLPEILQQANTGVWPRFRSLGLGRWLKAAMLEKILKDRPQVKIIRTGNADSNAAMLKINNELGFKPYLSEAMWQVGTERVQAYLAHG